MNTATQLESTGSKSDAEHAAKTMGDYVNNFSCKPEEFVEHMSRQHRSLQQSYTRVCLLWLKHLSELEEFQFDGRNEASVNIAKRLLKERPKIDPATGQPEFDPKYDLNLPTI